jgi:hypothetical protein
MISEQKRFKIQCDRCNKAKIVYDYYKPALPKGWDYVFLSRPQITDSIVQQSLCPKCLKVYHKEG